MGRLPPRHGLRHRSGREGNRSAKRAHGRVCRRQGLAHGDKEIPYPIVAGLNPAAARRSGHSSRRMCRRPSPTMKSCCSMERLGTEGSAYRREAVDQEYFDPEVEGDGKLKEAELTLRGYIPLAGAARDRDLTPEIIRHKAARIAFTSRWIRSPPSSRHSHRCRHTSRPCAPTSISRRHARFAVSRFLSASPWRRSFWSSAASTICLVRSTRAAS